MKTRHSIVGPVCSLWRTQLLLKKWMYFYGREPTDFTVLMIKDLIIYPTFYIVVLHLLLSWCEKSGKKKKKTTA